MYNKSKVAKNANTLIHRWGINGSDAWKIAHRHERRRLAALKINSDKEHQIKRQRVLKAIKLAEDKKRYIKLIEIVKTMGFNLESSGTYLTFSRDGIFYGYIYKYGNTFKFQIAGSTLTHTINGFTNWAIKRFAGGNGGRIPGMVENYQREYAGG